MEDVHYLIKQFSFQREGHSLITSRTTEAHQETTWGQIKGMQALYTPWSLSATLPLNHCYKTPHQIPPGWDTQFWGHEPAVAPFAWQSNRLFFSTLLKILSLNFDLALVHRGQVFGIILNFFFLSQWNRAHPRTNLGNAICRQRHLIFIRYT